MNPLPNPSLNGFDDIVEMRRFAENVRPPFVEAAPKASQIDIRRIQAGDQPRCADLSSLGRGQPREELVVNRARRNSDTLAHVEPPFLECLTSMTVVASQL